MTAANPIPRGAGGAALRDRAPRAARPPGVERPVTFSSVLCGVDRRVDSRAAHAQAVLLASPRAAFELVPAPRLTRHGGHALREACKGHDLLALAAGSDSAAVLQHAPIPVLIGRWSPSGTAVTDTILVPVDGTPASGRALDVAARLAAAHGGRVVVLVAPHRDPDLQRAIAASRRIVLQATGAVPTVLGEQLPRERAIPAAAIATNASLVVLGTGETEQARWTAAQIAGRIGASVLVVPAPAAPGAVGSRSHGEWAVRSMAATGGGRQSRTGPNKRRTGRSTMPVARREAEVVWNGPLARGAGALTSASGALEALPVTWASRTERPDGKTSPEELIAGAHASCFAMALALVLGENDAPPERLTVGAACTLDEVDGAPRITTVELTVEADVPKLDATALEQLVGTAADLCPVSNALRGNVEITVHSKLAASAAANT